MPFFKDSLTSVKSVFGLRAEMKSLVNIVRGGPFLGVDIGTTSIKLVEVHETKEGGLALGNYGILETFGYLERANSALQTSSLKLMEEETTKYLTLAVQQLGAKTNLAVASLPAFSAFTTLIELPTISDKEVERVIALQGKQYIPLPIETVRVDWLKVGERTTEQGVKMYQILLIAVVSEQVKRYENIFRNAGLHLRAIEIEGISMARILATGAKEPVLIVDIGSRSTGFVVAADGMFRFGGQTDFSGGSLTQTIANGLGITTHRAETLKRLKGLGASPSEQELSTLMEPILDVIINEAIRVKESYETNYKAKVARVILTGGGANLNGFEQYFGKQSGMQATVANPFEKIQYPPTLAPAVRELGPLLSVALGLGVKGMTLS